MKSIVNHLSESNNNQAEPDVSQEVISTNQARTNMASGLIPDLKDICQNLSNSIIKNGNTANNALQFVPVLNEMRAIEQFEVDVFIKNHQTNHVLIENEFIKIVLIHWPPGKISSIHGHPKGSGIFKVISGDIEELRYTSDNIPKLLSVSTYHEDAVGYIDDQLAYHAVGNPHMESAISLHVYTRL